MTHHKGLFLLYTVGVNPLLSKEFLEYVLIEKLLDFLLFVRYLLHECG